MPRVLWFKSAASSEYSLGDLGDLAQPNLGFQVAAQILDNLGPDDDQPLCTFQVTSFKDGGFAIGMSINHILFDGIGAEMFTKNLATQAFDDKPLSSIPCHNRHLLAARSPPHVAFPHTEFFKPDLPSSGPPVFDCEREDELDYKMFKLTFGAINYLKEKAKDHHSSTSSSSSNYKITTFNVVAALVWRCKALSNYIDDCDKDKISSLLYAVDIRSRLINPPLPSSYCGNAVICSKASAKYKEIKNWPFSEMVKVVSEGPARVTDEYVKSVIDWLEINKEFSLRDYVLTSWLRVMRFDEVVYPWGKPLYSGPVVNHRKDICCVLPDTDRGINVLVSLPAKEMESFQAYFRDFFPDA
ncbi:hypothetical protein DH2020_023944 [Rehmannia glutinosa]|uniref:Uncharacterized protein n=1 Tax=Rehmannia glutinosa TaxID=99300 RepID=A0ABR0WAF8_REHGL